MKYKIYLFPLAILFSSLGYSQDTFSIVAVDSTTGEVGSAGASCVDLTNFPGLTDHFLGELFPGFGAINSQAYYIPENQANARARMNAGDEPAEIIDWLIHNDVNNQPQFRQYGIVAFVDGNPVSAAHTGTATDDYKNHVTGPNYSIQGNILLGQIVLDSMESMFLNTEGDLACKLMAAMQGANLVGADTRCTSNGSSSLFAFIKVAKPDDSFGNPSFVQSVRTASGGGIEPIDSLQILFDATYNCEVLNIQEKENFDEQFSVAPNPFIDKISINNLGQENFQLSILDANGKIIEEGILNDSLIVDTSLFPAGIYFVKLTNSSKSYVKRMIKN